MSLYKGLDAQTLEANYNLGALRPDLPQVQQRWLARAAAHAAASRARIDLPYGEGERERFDFFSGGNPDGPLLIYIHGGYWQRGDKNLYSWISEAFIRHGVSVAIPNYTLTPAVRIGRIAPQLRRAVARFWHDAGTLGFSRSKMHVMGHSAGGHLTAMMMATDWPAVDGALPADLFRAAMPISGLYELEPLVHTTINAGPQMDVAEARAESPCNIPPLTDAPQLVIAGAAEPPELIRQSDDYAAQYRTTTRKMERYNVPGADHFDELEPLAQDDSVLFGKVMNLISTAA
ncbi:MAG: alpha/beta hydrolase [Burkholderiaceae bacterium]